MTTNSSDYQERDPVDKLHAIDSELIIGLVGAIGTELDRVGNLLENQLVRTGYHVHRLKISQEIIPMFGPIEFEEHDQFDRINKLMDAGNNAREATNDNSILALGAASRIAAKRKHERHPSFQTAVIIDSLKRPEEVERLRKVYPSGFILLGVHAEENRRLQMLIERGISQDGASELIKRDANENIVRYGQRLEKTFYLSDFFVNLDGNDDRLRNELQRIVELLFGHPFQTPSFDEYAMFLAFAAALRSADLSRQVGAVIAHSSQVLSTGANDCPRAGGGLYWLERDDNGCLYDFPEGRDHTRGGDTNKFEQLRIVDELVELGEKKGLDSTILKEVLSSRESPIIELTEYGRVVHAEMDALTSCARSGISTQGATLYCTTFPCHNCAKHIVAAGISRVVYIEPYEKSKAPEFHQDSIVFDSLTPSKGKVRFEAFVGVGPRRFFDLFSMNLSSGYDIMRKDRSTGKNIPWEHKKARLRVQMLPSTYLDLEMEAASIFGKAISKKGAQNG